MSEMTAQERETKNAEGDARSARRCPRCGDSSFWKPFHRTVYAFGDIEIENQNKIGKYAAKIPARTQGDKGFSCICAECFAVMSPVERRDAYVAAMSGQIEGIRPVIRKMLDDGTLVEKAEDRERYDKQHAAFSAEHEAILAAMALEGK